MVNEILITVDDPINLYGPNNIYYNHIVEKYPKLKIVGRGDKLQVSGAEDEISDFESKLNELIKYYDKFGKLSTDAIDNIFSGKETMLTKDAIIVYGTNGRIIQARTPNQQKLVDLYDKNDLIFNIGPAGSGKTYTAIALAVRALKNKEVRRIILTRPAVEAGEHLGFLPGDMKEKLDPYLQPLYDALHDMIPATKLEHYMQEGIIQLAPLAYMRGRTLNNAFVILDEGQNTSLTQLKMFLTRMGSHAKFMVTGDISQIDLPKKTDSGLERVVKMLKDIKGIGVVEFDKQDIVRHRLVKDIVEAFEKEN